MTHWLALFVCVIANVTANVSFKRFVDTAEIEPTWRSLLHLVLHPWLWAGLITAALVLGSYLYAIKVVPLGAAYPIVTSLAMVGIALAGAVFFGEAVKLTKILGVLLIIGGVLLVARS
jgi:multidrug transporter EmrE-like cation transporter